MAARLCNALFGLRLEINNAYPKRDKASDGWLGDAAHRSRVSDHNPNSNGVVCAIDVDKDGVPAAEIVEFLRGRGKAGDRRLRGGYIIYRSRIAGSHTGWDWHTYEGSNPHDKHFHVSAGDAAADYDFKASWGVKPSKRKADRLIGLKNPPMTGDDVKFVQRALNACGNHLKVDGIYGRTTADILGLFQRHRDIPERGVGPKTWAALRKVLA